MASSRSSAWRRTAAVGAICALVAAVVLLVLQALHRPLGFVVALLSIVLLASAATRAVVSSGRRRGVWAAAALAGLVLLVVSVVLIGLARPWLTVGFVFALALGGVFAVYAQRGYLRLAAAPEVEGPRVAVRAQRRVLFLNPASGGGKVEQFDLVPEAQRRGVETVVLGRGDDLTELARRAAADGAQVLGMAGGDGSQADVAAVCVAHDLPFVCIPAGTRNHFALDLNLDRTDPRPALDAFVDGVETRIDHGLAGERFFVNNVCLGIYPYLVGDPSYRDGRIRAAAELVPALVDAQRDLVDLRFSSPDGTSYTTAEVLLISNNPYRSAVGVDGAGRRVSLVGGELGVLVIAADDTDQLARAASQLTLGKAIERVDGCDQWTAASLTIESSNPTVLAGVDGESLELPTPLELRVVPRGLRVIVPVGTPATPAPTDRLLSVEALGNLFEIAGGVDTGPFGADL